VLLACLLSPACTARQLAIHGAPDVAVPCSVEEGDLEFHLLLTTCMYARERYEVLFGRSAHPITIVVRDTARMRGNVRDGRILFEQPSMAAMARTRSAIAMEAFEAIGEPAWLLGHELGHLLLMADTRADRGGYGSILPDWLDEGVAIWTETEVERAQRIRQAAELDDVTLDLLVFTTLQHPNASGIDYRYRSVRTSLFRCRQAPCDASPIGRDTFRIVSVIDLKGVAAVDTLFPEDPEFHNVDVGAFYEVASTILPFFHARGGPPLVNLLVERTLAGRSGAELFANLPGLPPAPADVNREWRAFVRATAAASPRSP
jgi:hypothetical protein